MGEPGSCLLFGAEPHGSRSRNRTAASTDIRSESAEEAKKKKGANITADQLEIRDFRLSTTRLEPGARADGVVLFDRPNYKQSSEKLFLQIAQADKVFAAGTFIATYDNNGGTGYCKVVLSFAKAAIRYSQRKEMLGSMREARRAGI